MNIPISAADLQRDYSNDASFLHSFNPIVLCYPSIYKISKNNGVNNVLLSDNYKNRLPNANKILVHAEHSHIKNYHF